MQTHGSDHVLTVRTPWDIESATALWASPSLSAGQGNLWEMGPWVVADALQFPEQRPGTPAPGALLSLSVGPVSSHCPGPLLPPSPCRPPLPLTQHPLLLFPCSALGPQLPSGHDTRLPLHASFPEYHFRFPRKNAQTPRFVFPCLLDVGGPQPGLLEGPWPSLLSSAEEGSQGI